MAFSDAVPVVDVMNGGNNGNGMFGGDGWWAIIIFALIFGWGRGGYGFGGLGGGSDAGAAANYVLNSDFATLQRQLSDGFGSTEAKLDSISNGICSLGYDQLAQMNGINTNIMQGNNALATQLADCCCKTQTNIADLKYANTLNANETQRQIERGFADTNYNMATQHCETLTAIDRASDRLLNYLNTEKMQTLRDENQALRLAASQSAQNTYLINQLRPCPIPAYPSCNPWAAVYGGGNSCGCA